MNRACAVAARSSPSRRDCSSIASALSRSSRARSPPARRWSTHAATKVSTRGDLARSPHGAAARPPVRAPAASSAPARRSSYPAAPAHGRSRLRQSAAQRAPAADRVRHRHRHGRAAEVHRAAVALPAGAQQPGHGPRPAGGERHARGRPDQRGAQGERGRGARREQAPPLRRRPDRVPPCPAGRPPPRARPRPRTAAGARARPDPASSATPSRARTPPRPPPAGRPRLAGPRPERGQALGEGARLRAPAARRRWRKSSRVPAPPATRTTSVTDCTTRLPSGTRGPGAPPPPARPATCSRTAACGRPTPAISASVSILRRASTGEFACTVVSEPSWPVFRAWSMSSASPPRTSPTTMRSGRMRSALRTSCRIVTSPRPSRFAGRDSSRTTCGWRSRSSAASSIVTTRSPAGIVPDSAPSVVVFPDPGAPGDEHRRPRGHAQRQELGHAVADRARPGRGREGRSPRCGTSGS